MGLLDTLQEILYSLRQNKLRTFLTGFGVFWGIFMLILLLGAGKGMQNGIEQGFSSDATNSVWIWGSRTAVPYKGMATGRNIQFNQNDLDAIKNEIPGILYISAENPVVSTSQANNLVRSKNKAESYGVFGVADNYFKIKKFQEVNFGRKLNGLDEDGVRKVATIGSAVAKSLFPFQNPVGQAIEVNKISFKVVGVFHDSGQNGRQSERVYIPMSTYQQTFGRGNNTLNVLTYQPRDGVDPYKTEEQVVALLKKRHVVSPDDKSAIRANNILRQVENVNALFIAINSFIWFVGIGTLTAGIVGISNIMMITVKERTVEIGVRKALGATPLKIVFSLLFESVLVTAIAGYIGLVFAVGLLEVVNVGLSSAQANMAYFKQPEVDFDIAVLSIVILVSVGAFAGFAPAWRAARISPVEAMQSE
ncbi:MAG: putative ABC transport system permease protein [Flavobacteriales bacterium]|jgi:putative ABC transport system permease protein